MNEYMEQKLFLAAAKATLRQSYVIGSSVDMTKEIISNYRILCSAWQVRNNYTDVKRSRDDDIPF